MAHNGTAFDFAAGTKGTKTGAVLIVPLAAKPQPPMELMSRVDALCDDALSGLVDVGALHEDVGHLAHSSCRGSYRRLLAVSLGDSDQLDARQVRKAAASAAQWLVNEGLSSADVWIDGLVSCGVEDAEGAWVLGMSAAGYRFDEHKQPDEKKPRKVRVVVRARKAADVTRVMPRVQAALKLSDAVNYTRALSQQPGNIIQPNTLATEARRLAARHKLKCTVVEGQRLRQMRMGGLIAVGQGAQHAPRLIRLEYRGTRGTRKTAVLVGKAITFDTGGYSIKPSQGLAGLKYDKTGGCTVMGVLMAAATLKLKCNLIGLVAAAENMVSDRAYRAGDIIHMANGKTVEVTNTDAEGRLVLADALWYAQKYCKPTALIDIATLTGGVGIALGKCAAGLMSNDDELSAMLGECGRVTHERLWRLPLWDDYKELMVGTDSDLVNSSSKRDAHCIQGGIFLKQFVNNSMPWAHLDIAAVASDDTNGGKVASGFGVRLLVEYLRRQSVR